MSEEEILIALKEIHARYCIPASEQNYTDKDYACMQYEKLVMHLQKEIDRLNSIINRIDNFVDRTIEVIKQQPSGNNEWILEKLNGIKYLTELKEE